MAKEFTPKLDPSGKLDADHLAQAGLHWVTDWLKRRLSGNDPWFPVDPRMSEDPDALIVALVKDRGAAHPLSGLIGRAVRRLLEEADAAPAKATRYLQGALRVCQQVYLPGPQDWFVHQLRQLSESTEAREAHWGGFEVAKELIFAALTQAPGSPGSAARSLWEGLLNKPRYATLAFATLAQNFDDQIRFLPQWWSAAIGADRERELDHLIFAGARAVGPRGMADTLDRERQTLPDGLKQAIGRSLARNGLPDLFAQQAADAAVAPAGGPGNRLSHSGAISDAGHRREFILPDVYTPAGGQAVQ